MKIQIALATALLALTPIAATAASQEEQQACMNDAFSVCGDAIPDHGKVAACLAKNINRISTPCRTVMLRYQQPAATANVSKPAPQKASKGPMNIKPKISEARAGSRS